jgi:hypothetical protein
MIQDLNTNQIPNTIELSFINNSFSEVGKIEEATCSVFSNEYSNEFLSPSQLIK